MTDKEGRPICIGITKNTKRAGGYQAIIRQPTASYTHEDHIRNFIEDYIRAKETGFQPNQMLTLVLERFDKTDREHVFQRAKNLRRSVADCLRRHRTPYIAVGVYENNFRGGYGLHIHMLLYLPENQFSQLMCALTQCLAKLSRKYLLALAKRKKVQIKTRITSCDLYSELAAVASDVLPFRFSTDIPMTPQESERRLAYLCKSLNPDCKVTVAGKTLPISEFDRRLSCSGRGTELQAQSSNRPSRPVFSSKNIHQKVKNASDEEYNPSLIEETMIPDVKMKLIVDKARDIISNWNNKHVN